MILELIREGSIKGVGTPGYIQWGDYKLASIEREWLDNIPFISCVPIGMYKLFPYDSVNYPNHYVLVNEELGIYTKKEDIPEGENGRYAILIHTANIASELAGCISVGMGRGYVAPKDHSIALGVINSRTAHNLLKSLLDKDKENFIMISEINTKW